MGTPGQVRLIREGALVPRFDDARSSRAQASHLREPDAYREGAIDIEGNEASRGKALRSSRMVILPRLLPHALHAGVNERIIHRWANDAYAVPASVLHNSRRGIETHRLRCQNRGVKVLRRVHLQPG